jgi:hypothetical protein
MKSKHNKKWVWRILIILVASLSMLILVQKNRVLGYAEAKDTPQIVAEKNGQITNHTVVGQLAPTRQLACMSLDQIQNIYTPPDIYTAFKDCADSTPKCNTKN